MSRKFLLLAPLFLLVACAPAPQDKPSAAHDPFAKLEGCQWKIDNLDACVQIVWEKGPSVPQNRKDLSVLKFRLVGPIQDKNPSLPIDLQELPHVEINMPDMCHGSSEIVVERIAPGLYRASFVNFTMPGYWELSIQQKDKNNKVLNQVVIPVDIAE